MNVLASGIMYRMITYFQGDVKRINHALKVYGFAKSIAEAEGVTGETLTIIEASAILHDIGIKISEQKYNSSAGRYQEIEGPPIAESLLRELGIKDNIIDRVGYLIGNHHTYSKIEGVDFQILVEADFLVNIFEDNMTKEQIISINKKYFKTPVGQAYLNSMYLA